MINIRAQDLKDFRTCELLYQYRYLDDLAKTEYKHPRVVKQTDYEATIKKIASFFFYKKQAYLEPSYQALLNRWQKLWFQSDRTVMDIATAQYEVMWGNEVSYTNQASMALLDFYNDFADKPEEQVMLTDEPFMVQYNKDVVLHGTFDLVLRVKNALYDKYIVYKWSGVHKRPPSNFWLFDFAIMDYAFRYRHDFKPIDVEYKLWDFGSSKPGVLDHVITENDHTMLKYWSSALVNTKLFVPRRDLTPYCKQCPYYNKQCAEWTFPTKEPTGEEAAKSLR